MNSSIDNTFLTRPRKQRTTFEIKYLERFGNQGDKRIGLPGLSPQLVDKQREMEKTNNDLEDARAKFEVWKVNFQKKRKEIEEKQATLAEQKRTLDQFTLHHNAELEKARKREEEETQMSRQIKKELQQLSIEEEELRAHNNELEAEIAELQPYNDFLQSVVESCRLFDNIDAILNRHKSLEATRREYLNKYQEIMIKFGVDQAELSKSLEIRKSYLIDTTMKFNEELQHIAQAKQQNEYQRTSILKEVQRLSEKTEQLAAIKTSIRNIWSRCLSKSKSNADRIRAQSVQTEQPMLQYIEERFTDLKDIINDEHAIYKHSPRQAASPIQPAPQRELTNIRTNLSSASLDHANSILKKSTVVILPTIPQ